MTAAPGTHHHSLSSVSSLSRFAPMGPPTAPPPLNRADIADGFSPASQAAHQSLALTFEAAAATGLTASAGSMPSAYAGSPPGAARGGGRGHARLGSSFASFSSAVSDDTNAPAAALAQAQAHLMALHQSRAQVNQPVSGPPGGGRHGHHRSLSTTSDAPGSGPQQRKPLFGTYLPYSAIAPLVATGAIWVGTLRINQRNRGGAYVRPASDLLQQQLLLHHASQAGDSAQSAAEAALASARSGTSLAASGQMPDIFISGSKDRNRALHGDVVAVELLDPQEVWSARQAKEDKKRRKENMQQHSHSASMSSQGGQHHHHSHSYSHSFSDLAEFTRGAPAQSGNNALGPGSSNQGQQQADDEVEGTQLGLPDDEADDVVGNALDGPGSGGSPSSPGSSTSPASSAPPPLVGHVVGIIERPSGQLYAGTLALQRPSAAATREKQAGDKPQTQGRPRIVWFRPVDKRVPLMAIPADQAPDEFWVNPSQENGPFSRRLFIATLKRWPVTSLHPFGSLVEDAGVMGNLEAETIAIVRSTLAISAEEEAGRQAMTGLPAESDTAATSHALAPLQLTIDERRSLPPPPWVVPAREAEIRRDLRPGSQDERTVLFSLGPAGGEAQAELAISFNPKPEGDELAVHIADLPYFVKPSSPLDRLARRRGTATALVQPSAQDSVAMLPSVVGAEYASLRPDQDRLAISFFFTLPPLEGEKELPPPQITWAGRSVIRSSAHVSWEEADALLATTTPAAEDENAVAKSLRQLGRVVDILHAARLAGRAPDYPGGVDMPDLIPQFTLDNTNLPIDAHVPPRSLGGKATAHQVLEQVAALANQAAAKLIGATLPDAALLRRAPAPSTRRLTATCARLQRLTGYPLLCLEGGDKPSTPVPEGIDSSLAPDRPVQPSAQALQGSLERIGAISLPHRIALEAVLRRVLASAPAGKDGEYFSAGLADIGQFAHWTHGTAIDTHCTSPLSSYADMLVLRQVLTAVSAGALTGLPSSQPSASSGWDGAEVARIALQANTRLGASERAMGASAHLYLCLLIHDLSMRYGPVVRMATVTAVHEASFDVLLPFWGVEKRVHAEQLPLLHVAHDAPTERLTLYWDMRDTLTFLRSVGTSGVPPPADLSEPSDKQAHEAALFDDEDKLDLGAINAAAAKGSVERTLSLAYSKRVVLPTNIPRRAPLPHLSRQSTLEKTPPEVPPTWGWTEGTVEQTPAGHCLQTVSILDQVPVLVTVEMAKSPPVLKVYALNPFNQLPRA